MPLSTVNQVVLWLHTFYLWSFTMENKCLCSLLIGRTWSRADCLTDWGAYWLVDRHSLSTYYVPHTWNEWKNKRRFLLSRNLNVIEIERCLVFKITRNQRDALELLGIAMYLEVKLIGYTCNSSRLRGPVFDVLNTERYKIFFVHTGDLNLHLKQYTNSNYFLKFSHTENKYKHKFWMAPNLDIEYELFGRQICLSTNLYFILIICTYKHAHRDR